MRKFVWICFATLTLASCQFMMGEEGQKVFYWQRANTGVAWFAKDHRECLQEADLFPFEWPSIPLFSEKPKDLKLRFDNDAPSGVWAQFVPFPGAQPVYVNSAENDWSVDYTSYQECMEGRHYHQRLPATQNRQVFPM